MYSRVLHAIWVRTVREALGAARQQLTRSMGREQELSELRAKAEALEAEASALRRERGALEKQRRRIQAEASELAEEREVLQEEAKKLHRGLEGDQDLLGALRAADAWWICFELESLEVSGKAAGTAVGGIPHLGFVKGC